MFKLVVLFVLLAVAAARPGGLYHSSPVVYSSPIVHGHGLLPAAVSHQSSVVHHGSTHLVAPVLKTYASPVLSHSYGSPLISSAWPSYSGHHLSYAASPLHYGSPYGYASGW